MRFTELQSVTSEGDVLDPLGYPIQDLLLRRLAFESFRRPEQTIRLVTMRKQPDDYFRGELAIHRARVCLDQS